MNPLFPIVLGCDNNYFKYGLVTLQSLIIQAKTKHIDYHIYFLHEDISVENQAIAQSLVQHLDNVSIDFITLSDFKQYQVYCGENIGYINESTYYRMFIPKVFPQYDQVLYLDCDIIVNFDVGKALVNFDFQNKILAAVSDKYIMHVIKDQEEKLKLSLDNNTMDDSHPITINDNATKIIVNDNLETSTEWLNFNPKYYYQRLRIPNLGDYFNAGVIMFNLKKIRELQLVDRFIDVIDELSRPIFRDQDLLNYLAFQHGGVYHLDRCFNFCLKDRTKVLSLANYQGTKRYVNYHQTIYIKFLKKNIFKKHHKAQTICKYWAQLPYVFHFLSNEKPWLYYYPAADKYIWWAYASLLPQQIYQVLLTSTKIYFTPEEYQFIATLAKQLQ